MKFSYTLITTRCFGLIFISLDSLDLVLSSYIKIIREIIEIRN
jgi:hypothetical protein